MEKPTQQQQQQQQEKKKKESGELEENPPQEQEQELISSKYEKKRKKRKRKDEKYLERLKGLCEGVVKKMMEKQEHLHNQLIQELIRRDQEKIDREEAWKNQEMERIRTQFESRSNDHKSAAERQAAIIDFLNRFTSDDDNNQQQLKQKQEQEQEHPKNNTNSNSSCTKPPPRRPPSSPRSKRDDSEDVGRRWPRDEVVALINLRCRMSGETEATSSKEKGPLWERISKGMMEMGYKRSGKRCKEKWENINKYFRKTKDSSKKRSLNSRTCPYFHHLNSLYGDGTVVAPVSASVAADVELGEERDNGGAIVDVSWWWWSEERERGVMVLFCFSGNKFCTLVAIV